MGEVIEGEFSARIDDLFAGWDTPDSPGAAIAALLGGEVVHQRGYGMANLDHGIPIASDSVFHVASVSKQFTAIAVALLADEGKLSLGDDIRDYVPEMPDLGATITIRQCIHHTSGLRDQYGLFRLAGWRDD
ncbi:MAG TPA: serine hydrolase domain-containing protein, partial [Thermomicrobiales bacterium]|nr:serine hydrolase domain-containing protein [Thermomicrobiales bacterium]